VKKVEKTRNVFRMSQTPGSKKGKKQEFKGVLQLLKWGRIMGKSGTPGGPIFQVQRNI